VKSEAEVVISVATTEISSGASIPGPSPSKKASTSVRWEKSGASLAGYQDPRVSFRGVVLDAGLARLIGP
jgi:hypothetical protein